MIRELRLDYPLMLLCRVLRVSRSGYHAWLEREPSKRAKAKERFKLAVGAAQTRTRATYGALRLQKKLAADGFTASLGVVKRVRREMGLQCVQQKKRFRVTTTDSRHHLPVAPNLLEQRFAVTRPERSLDGGHHLRADGGRLGVCRSDQGFVCWRGRRARLR